MLKCFLEGNEEIFNVLERPTINPMIKSLKSEIHPYLWKTMQRRSSYIKDRIKEEN